MTDTATCIDYTAARERLASVTADPAALAGMDRIAATGQLNDALMAAVNEHDISLDWLFLGKGEPFMKGEGVS